MCKEFKVWLNSAKMDLYVIDFYLLFERKDLLKYSILKAIKRLQGVSTNAHYDLYWF